MKSPKTSIILHLADKLRVSTIPITARPKRRARSVISSVRFGVIFVLIAAAAFYTASSARSSKTHKVVTSGAGSINQRADLSNAGLGHDSRFIRSGDFFAALMPQAGPDEAIATYAAASNVCSAIPKTSFLLGEQVCAKVTDAPLRAGAPVRRVNLTGPKGFVRDTADVTTDPQDVIFTLPTGNTSVIDGQSIDNRGTWSASLNGTSDSSTRAIAYFNVSDPANVAADLVVYDFSTESDPVPPGSSTGFFLWLSNSGPDPAANVHVTQATPPFMTYVSATTTSAFICTESAGVVDCALPPLTPWPSGAVATITLNYTISGGAPNGVISSTANISSDTNDPRTDSNSSSAQVEVRSPGAPPATCSLGCPPDVTATADTTESGVRGTHVNYSGSVEVSGDCGTITFTPPSGSFFPEGTSSVSVTSSTGGGSCSFTVTVIDTPPPTIDCPDDQTAQAPPGQTEASVDPGTATATGTGVAVTSIRSDNRDVSEPYPVGVTTITWRATDSDGRTASCNQTITVTSADAPTITCQPNRNFTAPSGECSYMATSGEIGEPGTTGNGVTFAAERSDGLHHYNDPYPAGQTVITWTATDDAGRTASCTQTITVNATDNEPPVLTVPPDVNAQTSSCTATVDDELGVATATDNCSSSVNISRSGVPTFSCPVPGDPGRQCESFVFPTGTTIITYTATDSAGNSTTGTQRVIVTENPPVPPTVTAPADSSASGNASCQAPVPDYVTGSTASDNCSLASVTQNPAAGTLVGYGPHTVTVTATDSSGNTGSDTVVFTVNDTTPPVITCPADIIEPTDPGTCTGNVNPGTATATDNCDSSPTIMGTRSDGDPLTDPYPHGTTTITWRATDDSGNYSECTQTITINAPAATALGPANIWVGLKNSDSVGLRFDLLAEVYKNNQLIGSGQINNVVGGSSGFNNAILRTIAIAQSQAASFCPGDQLKIKLSVRAGATGHVSGWSRLWYNDSAANSRFAATIDGSSITYYLLDGFITSNAAGPGPKKTIDVFVHRNQNGNAFKPFGTWVKTF